MLDHVKLAEWARSYGVHPQTAYRWFREAKLPAPAERLGIWNVNCSLSWRCADLGGHCLRRVK